ncbi:anti-repressor SinI family protein [Sutcliffiella deserti]|nr:anti-repressor SinI family protein [Sutcliffiella deserti]
MNNELDVEWIELIAMAQDYGLSVDEIKFFLQEMQSKNEEALVSK